MFHVPLDRQDDDGLSAVQVDDMIVMHGRVGKLSDDKRRAAERSGRG